MLAIPTKTFGLDKTGVPYYYCCMNSAETFDFQRYITNWRGKSGNDTVPNINEDVAELWRLQEFFGRSNTKYAIAIGTQVWPIIAQSGFLFVRLGNISKETKHEWIMERGMYDYGEYVCFIFSTPVKNETGELGGNGLDIVGFFVGKGALYIPDERAGKHTRGGKTIVKEVEVQSSSNKAFKHKVLYYSDGSISCGCHSWIYSKLTPKSCKHTKKVMLDIANGNPTP
jgi:hypothetical protein